MRPGTLLLLAALAAPALARDAAFPTAVTLPPDVKTNPVTLENFGQAQFTVAEGRDVVVQGRHWYGTLNAAPLGGDERHRYDVLVGALAKSGWKTVLGGRAWNPPYACLKLSRDGRELWLDLWVNDEPPVSVVEKGAPATRLALPPPAAGPAPSSEGADFPFLKRFPGSKLATSSSDDSPFLARLEEGQDPAMVASGAVIKTYDLPEGTGPLEPVAVYEAALKAAGWTIVELNTAVTTSDPNLTAHYAKDGLDVWAHVHGGAGLQLAVADAGAERASSRLKAQLDKTCKASIYGVIFDFNKAALRPDAAPALESLLRLLNENKDLRIELGGHTDSSGGSEYNQALSEARVASVKTWLTAKGVSPSRLTARGYGETQPIAPNDTPEGMAKNRRVELTKLDCSR